MVKRAFSALLALAMCMGLILPSAIALDTGANEEPLTSGAVAAERQVLNFNKGWRFEKGENKEAGGKGFDDSDWSIVNLPHDYSIENDFDPNSMGKSGGGYLDGGPAWYRKTWVIPASMADKRISIDFQGVYMNSKVYVNGTLVGNYPYGYSPFSYDITDYVYADGMTENVIAVYTDNEQPSSRWYSGSGIYRDVNLTVTSPIHVARYGTYVTTPHLEAEYTGGEPVTVSVGTEVANESAEDANVTVTHEIRFNGNLETPGSDEAVATVTTDAATVAAGATVDIPATLTVTDPTLWQVGLGGMYKVHTTVRSGDVTVDTYDTDFGFRWLDFTGNGFFINGEYTKMKGVCQHHDQGALGAVNNQTALDRQIGLLREMGVNAIRSSHNPASRALLNACNEQGIMVMNEAFDTWYGGKNDYDFHLFFDTPCTHPDAEPGQTWQEFDIKNMVNDAKNDPAVIMWSIGNEIGEAWDQRGRETGQQLAAWVREIDDSGRAVTMADPLFGPLDPYYFNPANNSDHWQLINNNDATGFNYGAYSDYDLTHELNPDWFIYSSETSSAVATRGEYFHPERDDDSHAGDASHGSSHQCSEFDNDRVAWGTTLHYALKEDAKRKYMGGVFFWTGFDYTGEPAPFAGANEAKSSYFGAIDSCGFPKDSFYLLQSQWLDVETDPMVHILPHWNWENDHSIEIDGKMPIRIYSNAPSVEIKLNGVSLGRKNFVQHPETETGLAWRSDDSDQENLYLQWLVEYAPGTVEAIAYDGTGDDANVIARDVKKTAGAPAAIEMTPERKVIAADGEDLAYIAVDIVDENGVMNPDANTPINFTITGNGRIVGTDNGNPLDWTNMKSTQRSAFNGKALVIVQSTTTGGSFTVTASAAGMPLSSATVYTKDPVLGTDSDILGYDGVSAKTAVHVQPDLPETVVAYYRTGDSAEMAVTWTAPADSELTQAGYITVSGKVNGTNAQVKATVEVVAPVGVRPVSAVTQPGKQPTLPGKVSVVYSDGSEMAVSVTWETISDGDLVDKAILSVSGTLAGMSGSTATAHVRVSSELSHGANWALASNGSTFEGYVNEANYDPIKTINDGIISYGTDPKNGWGNWCGTGNEPHETEPLTCTMSASHEVRSVTIHFREDGGIYIPSDTLIQYWNGTAWADVSNQSARAGFKGGEASEITFDPVTTDKIRATFTRGAQDTSDGKKDCVVITEFQIFETIPDAGKTTAELDTLTVGGEALEGFGPDTTAYTVDLPFGEEVPAVAAKAADNATVLVLPALSNRSAASIQVTSEDGKQTRTYSVQFVEAPAAVVSAALWLGKDRVDEDDSISIHLDATLQDGTLADQDFISVKYTIPDAGVPVKAEVKDGRFYAYKGGDVTLHADVYYRDYPAVAAEPLSVTIHPVDIPKSITGYAKVDVGTSLNEAPAMPLVVKASFDVGLAQDVAVTWDKIDPAQYARYGSFTVKGTVEGQALRPTATVTVRDVAAAQNQSLATPVGMAPALPATVKVYDTNGDATVSAVTWEPYDQELLKTEGSFDMSGTAELGDLPVTVTVRVTSDTVSSENYAQLWTGFKYSMAFTDFSEGGASTLNNGKVDKWTTWGGPKAEALKVGIIFGKDYPGLRYVDTVNLNFFEDSSLDRTGIKDCKVQYYNTEFKQEDTPKNPNNMLDNTMADNPLNNDANWTDVENLQLPESFGYGDNFITFDMVQTYALRFVLTKMGADGSEYYLCLGEIYTYGKSANSNTTSALTAITSGGVAIDGFDPATKEYTVAAASGAVPKIGATAGDNASVTVIPANSVDGQTKIVVLSEDGLKTDTYTVSFESDEPRYDVTVIGGVAYGGSGTRYAEGDEVVVVGDAAPAMKAFDKWETTDLELSEEDAARSTLTFTMPSRTVALTAVYKDAEPTDAELVAQAKTVAGTGIKLPYGTYADVGAMAEKATELIQAKIGAEVTALVMPEDDYFVLTLTLNDSGATVKPFEVTVEEKPYEPPYTPSTGGGKDSTIVKNPDGSTTTTVTDKKTGAVTETTKYPDGTKIVSSTPKDGETAIEITVPKGKDKVTVTIPTGKKPAPSEVAVIVKEDGTREVVKTSVSTEAGLRVALTESCKLEIVDNSKTFGDVETDHWAAGAVTFVTSRELFTGTGADTFSPAAGMTRGMLMTVLARLDGQDTTAGDTWYSAGMDWAKEQGISDGSAPEAEITRESLAVMLYRYAGNPEVDESRRVKDAAPYGEFADVNSVSDWAGDAMFWAVESGIITGSDNNLNPGGTATRAEVAAMLQRFISQ